jgi:hypothetical protein
MTSCPAHHGDSYLNSWTSDLCHPQALCVPFSDRNECECGFSENVWRSSSSPSSSCAPSPLTYIFFVIWCAFGISAALIVLQMGSAIARHKMRSQSFRINILTLSVIMATLSAVTLSFEAAATAFLHMATTQSSMQSAKSAQHITRGIFIFGFFSTVALLGCSILNIAAKAANLFHQTSRTLNIRLALICAGTFLFVAAAVYFSFIQWTFIANACFAVWTSGLLVLFRHIANKLSFAVTNNKMLQVRSNNSRQAVLDLMMATCTHATVSLAAFVVCTIATIVIWVSGRHEVSKVALGPLSGIAYIFQFGSLLVGVGSLCRILSKFLHLRDARSQALVLARAYFGVVPTTSKDLQITKTNHSVQLTITATTASDCSVLPNVADSSPEMDPFIRDTSSLQVLGREMSNVWGYLMCSDEEEDLIAKHQMFVCDPCFSPKGSEHHFNGENACPEMFRRKKLGPPESPVIPHRPKSSSQSRSEAGDNVV